MALSTRSGVRSKPSREGSSPTAVSMCRTSGTIDTAGAFGVKTFTVALFFICNTCLNFKDVAGRLQDAHSFQLWSRIGEHTWPRLAQPPIDHHAEVLGGGHQMLEFGDFFVQIAVIERPHNLLSYQCIEIGEIHDAASRPIDFALYRYLDLIIVAMPVWVVAFAENALILGFGEIRGMEPVGGRKLITPCQLNHGRSPKYSTY